MIEKKYHHREKSRQSTFIPKPAGGFWGDNPHPEQLGLHQMQKNKAKKKKAK